MTAFNRLNLRELADLESSDLAFVSIYLSPPDNDSYLAHRTGHLENLFDDEPEALDHLREGLKLARTWLDEHRTNDPSVCVFACFALDFVRGFSLPVEVPNRLWLGSGPLIRPLAELQDEYENFVFVTADANTTEIHLVSSAVRHLVDRVKGDIKNHVKKGGWSQKRYQRRRQNDLIHYAKEVADRLEQLSKERHFGRIVVLGAQETRNAILEALPPALQETVVADTKADLSADPDDLLDQAWELSFRAERDAEQSLWQRIKSEDAGEGLAAAGPPDVWLALANGRADAVAINRDLKLRGSKCSDCENVMPQETERCDYCQSKTVIAIDLVDAIVRQAQRTSAEVNFVEPIRGLTKLGGVAALLRY